MSFSDPLCFRCKGKGLCGKRCVLLDKIRRYKDYFQKENFSGSAPSVFVGTYKYPNVNIGLLSPTFLTSNAWLYDAPEYWYANQYSVDDIIDIRAGLVNSKNNNGKTLEIAQEIAMASKPVDTEFWLKKKPAFKFSLDNRHIPVGASANLLKAKSSNSKISSFVDKVVGDELKAEEQINLLYKKTDVTHITRILSVGLLGFKKRIVPTRWSITAVDDMLSKKLIREILDFRWIDNYELYSNTYLGNHFEILMLPRQWAFEVVETLKGSRTVYADYETHFERSYYAKDVTGAYYADRLAAAEHLLRRKKQASVLILREVYPDYMLPLGVWVNREAVRGALRKRPVKFSELDSALKELFNRVDVGLKEKSQLLRSLSQKNLRSF
jgi:hypothetical protein